MKWKSCTPPKLNKAPNRKENILCFENIKENIQNYIDMFGMYMERCFEKL